MENKEKEKIVNAIRNATNGTFKGDSCTCTLMGWIRKYDGEGREVTADPNYIDSIICIDDINYRITKCGWDVYIWDPKYKDASYTWCWMENYKDYLFAEIDTKPDYVKEYEKKHNL